MTVIKQNAWLTPTGLPEPTTQQLGENPHAYRELLMAVNEDGVPVPYTLSLGAPRTYVRVPHGLSTDAAVRVPGNDGDPNPVTVGHERIPDVAIPILVDESGNAGLNVSVNIHLTTDFAGLLGSTTGLWVDESYVYVSLSTGFPADAAFVVYVEYTHSIIRNEIVTGAYYVVAAPIPPPP